MPYDLTDASLWFVPGQQTLYRVLDSRAPYRPDEPFPSLSGRFSNGMRLVLYLSVSSETAIAEWLRHHPEFIELQDDLRIVVNAVDIESESQMLDVRTPEQAAKIAFPFERLRSSDRDPAHRYRECQELANDCEDSGGIACPSAAYDFDDACNLVLFGDAGDRWRSIGVRTVARPRVPSHLVRRIET